MINGNEMPSERYDEFVNYLLSNVNHDNIDKITIKSLICSCVEFDEMGISKNACTFLDIANSGKSLHLGIPSAKINLKLLLDIILLNPKEKLETKIELIIFIIKAINLLSGQIVNILDKNTTIVLKTIYMLSYDNHGVSLEKIESYCKDDKITDIGSILKSLEDLKCIELIDDEYKLIDIIIFNFQT